MDAVAVQPRAYCIYLDLQVGLSHCSNYYDILKFIHTVHNNMTFYWLASHVGITGKERADSEAKAALQKFVSEYLISYTDVFLYNTL